MVTEAIFMSGIPGPWARVWDEGGETRIPHDSFPPADRRGWARIGGDGSAVPTAGVDTDAAASDSGRDGYRPPARRPPRGSTPDRQSARGRTTSVPARSERPWRAMIAP